MPGEHLTAEEEVPTLAQLPGANSFPGQGWSSHHSLRHPKGAESAVFKRTATFPAHPSQWRGCTNTFLSKIKAGSS